MPVFSRNLSSRITAALALYLLLTALLLSGVLNTQLVDLATSQQNALGEALGGQLAETLKQPVIDNDVISIQVVLDNLLATTPVVARGTVYSAGNRILAQSQRSTQANLAVYTRPINVDNTMLGQVRLELDRAVLVDDYRVPLWTGLGIWLLLSLSFALWLMQTASGYTRRILNLGNNFNDQDDPGQSSELERLETSLKPFINHGGDDPVMLPGSYAMLAVNIPNLPKWRAQLNAEHFTGMLRKVDDLIDIHLSLFKGARLQSRATATLLQFDDNGEEHPVYRAINCANALLHLSDQLVAAEKLPFEVRITAAYRCPRVQGSAWRNDLEREECIERLLDTLPLAGAWELIIDKANLGEEDLTDCDLELLGAASVWQFRAYVGARQQEFDQQLDFLAATLQ